MKKTRRFNYRVVVEPAIYLNDSEQVERAICEYIKEQIKRHVDNVSNVYIRWDTLSFCEHCGRVWEEDEQGCPLCCDKAIEEWEKQKKQSKDLVKDLGYANSWSKTPDIVKACEARGHIPEEISRGRCLTEYRCEACGYKYLVDSSG